MININSFKQFESKVDNKIQLLQDLSLELKDVGLQVEVINGSHAHLLRDPRVTIHSGSRYSNDYKKYIVMRVTDDNELFNADLYYTDTIQDFIETLKLYGMNPRGMSGGNHFAVFKFDKWGKMTDSDYFKNISESIDGTQDIQHHYSIYDWFEDLKSMQWSRKSINKSELKKWTEHFIGRGWYDKISKKVDHIFDSIRKVDINYIEDRMLEVWDELPSEKEKYVMFAVAYGDYENFDKEIDYKYNGLISVMSPQNDDLKLDVIIYIIKEIIYPTTHIGSPSIWLRRTEEQEYVTDKKWNCENFNIDNYDFKEGEEFDNGESGRRSTTTIFKHELEKKKYYSPDKVIQMYKPCIVIEVGGHHNSHMTGTVKLSHLEPLLDDILETILPELNYEAVIWDKSRGKRRFTDDEFSDYTLKIILK